MFRTASTRLVPFAVALLLLASPTKAAAQLSLASGDIYRVTFTVDPAAWPAPFTPDLLVVSPSGDVTCTGGEVAIDIFDGQTPLGSGPTAICGINAFYAPPPPAPEDFTLEFAPILDGSIQGRLDIRILGTSATFTSWELALCQRTPTGLSCVGATGITILNREVIHPAPTVDLKVNGIDEAEVETTGQVQLTVSMTPNGFTEPLTWYWLLIADGQVFWVTADGVSTTPAPLATLPPAALDDVALIDWTLKPGTVLTNVWFLFDGSTLVASDAITANAVAPAAVKR